MDDCTTFVDCEYQMEQSLHDVRLHLIKLLDEDECLQCLKSSCCCTFPDDVRIQDLDQHLANFLRRPPPATALPIPHWLQGDWSNVKTKDLLQAWGKIKSEDLDKSWVKAKADLDLISTESKPDTKTPTYIERIDEWLTSSPKKSKSRIVPKLAPKDDFGVSKEPVWPPKPKTAWEQMKQKNADLQESTVQAFFQMFRSVQTTFATYPQNMVFTRMSITHNGMPLDSGSGYFGDQFSCAI